MAASSKLQELIVMADEIEDELGRCGNNLKGVGALSVKIQSLQNMLRREDQDNGKIKQLQVRTKYFLTQVRILSEKCTAERDAMEQEMEDSKIRVKKISETYDPDHEMKERDFYSKQSSRVDDFISNTMDSLESLKRQGAIINRVNERITAGIERLGYTGDFIRRIEQRFGRDTMFFILLFGALFILVLLLRFGFN